MKYRLDVQVGPIGFRVGSAWASPIAALTSLYAGYAALSGVPDYTVRLEPQTWWRRYARPSVAIRGDYMLPDALPLPLAQGLLAAEMGMNLQLALGERRYLLLHAASVEKDGQALILTGESGSGKSTLSALLGANGWRFMGDEFVLIDPETGMIHPFPRPVSLKNASISVMEAALPDDRFGPRLTGTPKGDIRHLRPDAAALAAMDRPAKPRLILFPRFGFETALRDVPPGEAFVRLTQASTNYTAMGERGFEALSQLVTSVPAKAIDYPDTQSALDLVASL
jgi:HprK-related kinase A